MANKYNKDGMRVQAYDKGKYVQMANDELHATLTMGLKSLEEWKPRQTRSKYPNTPDGFFRFQQRTWSYLKFVDETNMLDETNPKLIPDMESWAVFVGISRHTLPSLRKRDGEWAEYIDFVTDIIGAAKKQLAMKGCIPSVIAMFDLTNNHKYHNTNEFHLTTVVEEPKDKLSADELIQRAKALPGFSDETSLPGPTEQIQLDVVMRDTEPLTTGPETDENSGFMNPTEESTTEE